MKKVFITASFFLFGIITIFGQDIIYKKDGSEIRSKVIEITLTTVKYKKLENLSGPSYDILKNEVQKIVYENGVIDDFVKAEELEMEKQLKNNPLYRINSNGKTIIHLNGKEYSTENNTIRIMEDKRIVYGSFNNHYSVLVTLTSTFVTEDKRILVSFVIADKAMKAATFRAPKKNILDAGSTGIFSTSVRYLPLNTNTFIVTGTNIPISYIRAGKLTIETIDNVNRKISGTVQISATYVDDGLLELDASFNGIGY